MGVGARSGRKALWAEVATTLRTLANNCEMVAEGDAGAAAFLWCFLRVGGMSVKLSPAQVREISDLKATKGK